MEIFHGSHARGCRCIVREPAGLGLRLLCYGYIRHRTARRIEEPGFRWPRFRGRAGVFGVMLQPMPLEYVKLHSGFIRCRLIGAEAATQAGVILPEPEHIALHLLLFCFRLVPTHARVRDIIWVGKCSIVHVRLAYHCEGQRL